MVNLAEADWDLVVKVNQKGTFLVTQAAAKYWREQSKAGEPVAAAVVNTSSESGVFGNPGQANYAAAKAAVASLTQVAAKELGRYGVRVNAILPQARTRLTESAFGAALAGKEGKFDRWDPANVSPFVAFLPHPSANSPARCSSSAALGCSASSHGRRTATGSSTPRDGGLSTGWPRRLRT